MTEDPIPFNKVLLFFEKNEEMALKTPLTLSLSANGYVVKCLNTNCKLECNIQYLKYKLRMREEGLVYCYQGVAIA